jgi:hypothetical protein
MIAPSQYFDTIRLAMPAEKAALESFRRECGASFEVHPGAIDLAAFDVDGAPIAAIRLCLDVDACLCGLAIAESRLRSALPYRLTRAWYELALARGAMFATTSGRGPHAQLMTELGFMESPARPGTLRLALHDIEHLRRVGSPFAAAWQRWRAARS